MSDYLNIYYQNVNGLRTKAKELRSEVMRHSYDVVLLCETGLNDDFSSAEFFDDRYMVYRCDRNSVLTGLNRKGGCLIAVKKSLVSKRMHSFELGKEDVWVSVEHTNGDKTLFNVRYIELNGKLPDYLKHFDRISEVVMSCSPNDSFVLTGDYNLGDTVMWAGKTDGISEPVDVKGAIPNALIDLMSLCGLNQFNSVGNCNRRSLDLFISNTDSKRVKLFRSTDPLVLEDPHHPALRVCLSISPLKFLVEDRPAKTNFFRADYERLNEELSRVNWVEELDGMDIDLAVEKFYAILEPHINSIPKCRCTVREYPNYYSHQLISMICKKARTKKELNKLKKATPVDVEAVAAVSNEYRRLRTAVKVGISNCFDVYVKDCEDKLKSNSKCFFAFTKSLRKTNSLPNDMKLEGVTTSNRDSICNLFAKYFSSVFNPAVDGFRLHEPIYDPFVDQSPLDGRMFPEFTFSIEEVQAALKSFDVNKVSSPDNIPMMFFIRLSMSLGLPLSILFNKSLSEGKFPTRWKLSFVSPIFKDGDKADISNYRPISILCAVSKVFERLVFNKLFEQIKHNIHHSQHGFFSKRSAQSNLMEYVSTLANEIVNGGQVDSVYTDFTKAFDKVDHGRLIGKLKGNRLNSKLIDWFSSYLSDRSQRIVIGRSSSNSIRQTSGVPQGSILGPLLFLIFINDLLSSLSAGSGLGFADDLKVFRSIVTEDDCRLLQDDLDLVERWCVTNRMGLNHKKCAIMSITHSHSKIEFPYVLCGKVIERVHSKADLGVIIDDKLSFNEHVDEITRKAYKLLGFVFRCGRYFTDRSSFLTLYNVLVRNRLEYCSSVWNPFYQNAVDQIERVQKKFSRFLFYKFNIEKQSYDKRLKLLKLHSLESRRLENDELTLHKLVHHRIDSQLSNHLMFDRRHRSTRQRNLFYLPNFKTNIQRNSPLYRLQEHHDVYFSQLNLMDDRFLNFKSQVKDHFVF